MTVERATEATLAEVFDNLGPLAVRESVLFGGLSAFTADKLADTYVCFADNVPAAAFGMTQISYLNDTSLVWFVGTPIVHSYMFTFIAYCKDFIKRARAANKKLVAAVAKEFPHSLRWLRHIGFVEGATVWLDTTEGRRPFTLMEFTP